MSRAREVEPAWVEAAAELLTVRDLLRFAVSRFVHAGLHFGHGSDNAWDEAAYLVLYALALPLDRLDPFLDARVTTGERKAVLALLKRRVDERVPAAYLTGEAWIGEHRFRVDPRVIVPRSFIGEWLCDGVEAWLPDAGRVRRVLDLCTGSGCLAVLCAHAFPAASVDAVDISGDALAVAAANLEDHGVADRVRLLRGDLYAPLGRSRYDLIVSNPPYVTPAAMEALPQEYRHEPRIALDGGGEDGLAVIRRIVAGAAARLAPGGLIVLETGHARDTVERAFPGLAFTWIETSAGDDVVCLAAREALAEHR